MQSRPTPLCLRRPFCLPAPHLLTHTHTHSHAEHLRAEWGDEVRQTCNWAGASCAVVAASPLIGKVAQLSYERTLGTLTGGLLGFLVSVRQQQQQQAATAAAAAAAAVAAALAHMQARHCLEPWVVKQPARNRSSNARVWWCFRQPQAPPITWHGNAAAASVNRLLAAAVVVLIMSLLHRQVYDFGVLRLPDPASDVLMVVSAAAVGALSCYLSFKFKLDASMRLFVITFLIVSLTHV